MPACGLRPGGSDETRRPVIHDKPTSSRIANPQLNIVAELHGHVGDVERGFAEADVVHEGVYVTQRVQHAHLETHGAIGWLDRDGKLHIRTSSQTPFLTRDALCALYDLAPDRVRVFAERVGGGFGGKQEMIAEDIVALAVFKTGRPVKLEFTRQEQFSASTSRHPMRINVKIGARRDGRLTAISMRMLSNTGAYGNHGPGVMFHGSGKSVALYRCPNKKVDSYAVYTNQMPSGAFRGYGLSQTNFAIESAMDEIARMIGMDPFAFRRMNVVKPGDPMVSAEEGPHDVQYGSYGLDQCLDLVEQALGSSAPADLSEDWLIGRGVAAGMIDTIPPRGHRAESRIRLTEEGVFELSVGTAEFGNGTTTVHGQIAASILNTAVEHIRIKQSDTELVSHDTGAFGSTGTVVAGSATRDAAEDLKGAILDFAASLAGAPRSACLLQEGCVAGPAQPRCASGLSGQGRPGGRQARRHWRRQGNAALGRLQRPGLRGGGASPLWRNPHPSLYSRGGCRDSDQSDAMPGADRGRRRPSGRSGAL